MVLGPAGGYFDTAHGTALCGDHSPAVFAINGNFFTVQITVQLCAVGGKLDLPLELSAHCHEELVMGLDVIFADLADCDTAGEGDAFVQR